MTLLARDRNGAAAAPGPRLTVTPSPAPAPVRAGTRGFFERDGGGVFFPLGVELNAGKPDPSARLAAPARLGANAVLLPLPTAGRPGVLEEEDPRQGLAVDRVLEAAASRGIAVVLSLEAAAPAVDAWSGSAWNRENGGPLDEAREFWTHPTAAAIYRDRLRYAVARYGGSPAVLGWELRGEPDTAGDADVVRGWFQGMVEELKRVDPHARPVGVAPAGLAPAGADWTRDRSPGAGGQARAGSRPHVVAAGEAEGAVWKAIGGGSAGLFVPAGRESLLSAAREFVAGLPAAGDLALAYAEQGGPLALAGLAPGAWSAELWEPASGRRVGRMPVTVKPDGTARVDLAGRGPVVLRLRRGAGERGPGVR